MELKDIKGVGEKTLIFLNNMNIKTIDDLVFRFPDDYRVFEIENDKLFSSELICVSGVIDSRVAFVHYRKSASTLIFYTIVNGYRVKCVIFAQEYLRYKIYPGIKVVLYGKFKQENKEFVVQMAFLDEFVCRVEPVYHFKEIATSSFTRAIERALISGYKASETLPEELVAKYRLLPINSYIRASHFPDSRDEYIQVMRRRKYEEFFWYGMSFELLRYFRKNNQKLVRSFDKELIDKFINNLPYLLTIDQIKAINIIMDDIASPIPMNRLVQGDVGCGKSIVALIAALCEINAGFQAAVMVPTGVLAKQQFESFCELLKPFNLRIDLLTSGLKEEKKKDILAGLETGKTNLVIGTHALIEDNVRFNKLGLIVIDEQQRFGVEQRQKLVDKFANVDSLHLTATPIPRTLGLTEFGDLDITSIHSMPIGRKPVETHIVNAFDLDALFNDLKPRIMAGEQMYVIVPLVNENEEVSGFDIKAAEKYLKNVFPDVKIGVAHGQQKSDVKDKALVDFSNRKTQILLATTIIEVGVDVKGATLMVILDAHRFGLAQLHQLRGRIGRNSMKSYCYLVTSMENTPRLQVLQSTNDGFEISLEDFKLRGPGEYLGNIQSGHTTLNYADFEADMKIWLCAKEDSEIWCRRFINENIPSKKFSELLTTNMGQKGKIN